jgi:hypothetical protein
MAQKDACALFAEQHDLTIAYSRAINVRFRA